MKRLILLAVVLSVGMSLAGWRGRFDEQFAAATSTARLPAEYQEVEYLESTGTQRIDTGYYFTKSTIFEVKAVWLDTEGWLMYAVSTADNSGVGITFSYGPAKRFGFRSFGSTVSGSVWDGFDTTPVLLSNSVAAPNIMAANGAAVVTATQSSGSAIAMYSMRLFAQYLNGSISSYCSARIYFCKFTESGLLVRDYVPAVRKADSVAGMYDLVNGSFTVNSGTGTFAVGPDVQ